MISSWVHQQQLLLFHSRRCNDHLHEKGTHVDFFISAGFMNCLPGTSWTPSIVGAKVWKEVTNCYLDLMILIARAKSWHKEANNSPKKRLGTTRHLLTSRSPYFWVLHSRRFYSISIESTLIRDLTKRSSYGKANGITRSTTQYEGSLTTQSTSFIQSAWFDGTMNHGINTLTSESTKMVILHSYLFTFHELSDNNVNPSKTCSPLETCQDEQKIYYLKPAPDFSWNFEYFT